MLKLNQKTYKISVSKEWLTSQSKLHILTLLPALNDSIILHMISHDESCSIIQHVQADGSVVNITQDFPPDGKVFIPSSKTLLLYDQKQAQMTFVSLVDYQQEVVNVPFQLQTNGTIELYVFGDTQLICFVQINLNTVRLTYSTISKLKQGKCNLQSFTIPAPPRNVGDIQKIDNKSRIGWVVIDGGLETQQPFSAFVNIVSFDQSKKIEHIAADISYEFNKIYLEGYYDCNPGCLKIDCRKMIQLKNSSELKSNIKQCFHKLIQQTKQKDKEQSQGIQIIEVCKDISDKWLVYKKPNMYGWYFMPKDSCNYYFFINQQQHFKDTLYQTAEWDSDLVACVNPITYRQKKTQFIQLKVFNCFAIKNVFMHFLLWLNQDFDDDLLQDTIELLVQ